MVYKAFPVSFLSHFSPVNPSSRAVAESGSVCGFFLLKGDFFVSFHFPQVLARGVNCIKKLNLRECVF